MKSKFLGILMVVVLASILVFVSTKNHQIPKEEPVPSEDTFVQESVSEEIQAENTSIIDSVTEDSTTKQTISKQIKEIQEPTITKQPEPVVAESKDEEPQIIEEKKPAVTYTTQDIVKTWRPYVVRVTCIFLDANGNKKSYSDGSGLLSNNPSKDSIVVTNKHVFSPANMASSDYCEVYFPESKEVVKVEKKDRFVNGKGYDLGALVITQPSKYISELTKKQLTETKDCSLSSEATDSIVIIGYPKGASKEDVSYKEGQLVGYRDPYFISSATVAEGYSGGIAVSLKDNCFVGTVSAAYKEDLTKSLILDVNKF